MMLRRGLASRPVAGRRSAMAVRASAQPLPSLPLPGGVSAPSYTSFRAIVTDPTFRPATAGNQQYAPGAPQLLGRRLALNPIEGAAQWAEGRLGGLDRAVAAAVDGLPVVQVASAAVTAGLTLLGVHPLALLRVGFPEAVADWIELAVGGWAVPLAAAAALAVGLAAALWQARTWMAAQLWALRTPHSAAEGRVAAAVAAAEAPASEAPAAAAAAASEAAPGPAQALAAAVKRLLSEGFGLSDLAWAYSMVALRLAALLAAASALLPAPAPAFAAAATTSATAAAATAAACFAASLIPLLLPRTRRLLAANGADATRLAAPTALADAAFLAAATPALPLAARAAAAAALAAGLALAALAAAASPRLTAVRADDGDVATFHLVLRLPLSGTLVDTTVGHRPLAAVVGAPVESLDEEEVGEGLLGVSSSTDARVAGSTAATVDPQARFRPLAELLSASGLLRGMLTGQSRTAVLATAPGPNPDVALLYVKSGAPGSTGSGSAGDAGDAGDAQGWGWGTAVAPFRNPGLVWWQPLDDMVRKLAGSTPGQRIEIRPGDVFFFPVGKLVTELGSNRLSGGGLGATDVGGAAAAALPGADSWGPVAVRAVTGDWVQLDANAGLMGGEVEVEVRLQAVEKRGG
ncbi:hypothetical protein HYH03_004558 [Edaphochlamys debaryana]|uniref:Uncharacterized protein n=1 Tax=Edaphochlamys debaryana TaxID=47281 RepID=A0A835Y7D1_9CHLO|nr:hypothetical protein HYH03_004558 [Edaphochlamys debaryana]|eukprot:KAG2497403.1 hypothetical protein HYH03_004558 [Edaphochlamys debaryana]